MDNNFTQTVPTNPFPQPPIEPVKTSNPKGLLISLITLEVITLLVAGYFGYQYSQLKKQITTTQPTPTPAMNTTSATPESSTSQTSLPAGWTYQSDACNVRFPIPPKEAPYYNVTNPNRQPSVTSEEGSGRYWNFPRGGASPNMLSKLLTGNAEYKQASAMYASDTEASGYISQAVVVSCIPNNGRYTNNSALITSLTSELDKYNASTGEKGMQASTYKIKTNTPTMRWGKNVTDLLVTEDATDVKYTMLVTTQYVYEVRVLGGTGDSFVKETAQKIFNGLLFD